MSSLRHYAFSSSIEVFSCSSCASQLFCRKYQGDDSDGRMLVVTSALNNESGLVVYGRHIYIGDTVDGGGSTWLRKGPERRQPARWFGGEGNSERLDEYWPRESRSQKSSEDNGRCLTQLAKPGLTPLTCHCGGVRLYLKSGAERRQASLAKMPNSQPITKTREAQRLWELGIDAATGRFATIMDACDSCRRDVSSDIVYWAFAPMDHIVTSIESGAMTEFSNAGVLRRALVQKDARLGTLARYSSSPGVNRYHCSVCSASVLATNETEVSDPRVVGIAVGVVSHTSGARAEGILAWDFKRMDFFKEGEGGWRGLLNRSVLEEAEEWQSRLMRG